MTAAPGHRTLLVEADGGSRGNPGPAGYGAVVKDADGGTLREVAAYLGEATNNVAEYRGLLAGLRAAHALDPAAAVLVRMDSKLVVEQMSGRWQIKHPDLRPLAAQARDVFSPEAVSYEWIPRAENSHADRLANEAMDAGAQGGEWQPSTSTAELTSQETQARRAAPESDVAGAAVEVAADTAAAPNSSAPTQGWGPDLGPPTTFVLLRHGETPLTPQKRFSGSGGSDPQLSAAGRAQARAAAQLLDARGTVDVVVTSPLQRCRETAAEVAGRLGVPVHAEEGLRETDFGAWEGLTFAEARERYRADLDAWLGDPAARPTGGGESFVEVAERVAVARDSLRARFVGQTVLLVTHVTPIKTLVRLALGAPPEALFRMELSAASLSTVAYYTDGNASVRLLNDTSHLRS